jgi:acyl-coenzyme A thioesterase PaaI-like protein
MKAATVTVTTNYLAAAQGSSVVAHGRAVKRGKELIFCEVTICEADGGKTIANGTMIYRIT